MCTKQFSMKIYHFINTPIALLNAYMTSLEHIKHYYARNFAVKAKHFHLQYYLISAHTRGQLMGNAFQWNMTLKSFAGDTGFYLMCHEQS